MKQRHYAAIVGIVLMVPAPLWAIAGWGNAALITFGVGLMLVSLAAMSLPSE